MHADAIGSIGSYRTGSKPVSIRRGDRSGQSGVGEPLLQRFRALCDISTRPVNAFVRLLTLTPRSYNCLSAFSSLLVSIANSRDLFAPLAAASSRFHCPELRAHLTHSFDVRVRARAQMTAASVALASRRAVATVRSRARIRFC